MTRMLQKAGVAALLLLFTFAVACGGGDDKGYPEQVQNNFLESCTDSGGSKSQCRCALDAFEDKYSLEEFTVLERRLSSSQNVSELQSIILKCLGD